MKFSTFAIGGKFGKLLGKPYKPFYLMIYGNRFNGKSSVAMLLADELVKGGLNALYVSNEEGVKGSLQEKLLRLKIGSPIHFVEDYNPKQFRGYDAVFLDRDAEHLRCRGAVNIAAVLKDFLPPCFTGIPRNNAGFNGAEVGYDKLVSASRHKGGANKL